MAREIPEAVRAVAGLAATVLDEARKLPETLPGLPVRLVGAAMQTSLKVQQQYAGLVARGDELLTGLRGDSGAGLATFDDDEQPSAGPVVGTPARDSAFDRVSEADLDALEDDDLHDDLDVDAAGAVAAELAVDTGTLPAGAVVEDDAEVLDLPADPAADLVTAVVDELADDVADEVAEELPEAVPEEVAEELTADAVADLAGTEVDDETAIEQAVAEDLVADAVVTEEELTADAAGPASTGTNAGDAAAAASEVVPLDELTPDAAPADTETLDEAAAPVAALAEASAELTDLGSPDAPDEAAAELSAGDPADVAAAGGLAGGPDAAEAAAGPTPGNGGPDGADAASGPAPGSGAQQTPDTGSGSGTGSDAGTGTGNGTGTGGAALVAPVEGYDSFSIPALRGHLRAYPAETVADLLDYERATHARQPYTTLLQNRLEKLNADRG
jgi:hypothetical protein